MVEALVLNATYEPLCVVSQRRALVLVLTEKAVMIEAGDHVLRSVTQTVEVPVVVRLARYVRVPYRSQVPLTRKGVLARDHHRCVYCGAPATSLDHVIPRSRGGAHVWENVVAACSPCNLRKGSKLPKQAGMFPHQHPYQPTVQDLHNNGRLFPPNYLHESWMDYLYWDSELQP